LSPSGTPGGERASVRWVRVRSRARAEQDHSPLLSLIQVRHRPAMIQFDASGRSLSPISLDRADLRSINRHCGVSRLHQHSCIAQHGKINIPILLHNVLPLYSTESHLHSNLTINIRGWSQPEKSPFQSRLLLPGGHLRFIGF
jgi:hypothetical protein